MPKTIRDIIGEGRGKFSIDSSFSVRKAVEYMHENSRAAVAVLDGDRVAGVFSENDLLRRVVRKRLDLDKTSVCEVMSTPVHWISMDERYEVAKAIMIHRGIHHLVVMDQNRNYRGFVSSRELLEADLADSRELVGKLNDDYYEHRFKP